MLNSDLSSFIAFSSNDSVVEKAATKFLATVHTVPAHIFRRASVQASASEMEPLSLALMTDGQ